MNKLAQEKPRKKLKKEFTPADRIANENLCTLWATFRAKHMLETQENMTQEKAALLLGWTQSNLSQYLNGIVPIGFKAAQKLATMFNCKISDIRPDYRDISEEQNDQREELKSIMAEMMQILDGMRTGDASTEMMLKQAKNLSERVTVVTDSIEQTA